MAAWHFLIQTVDGHLRQDFAWALREAVDYAAWWDGAPRYGVTYADAPPPVPPADPDAIVPIGSLEWVWDWTRRAYGLSAEDFRPVYIPEPLRTPEFLGRPLQCRPAAALDFTGPHFVKSATHYKGFTDIVASPQRLPPDTYWVSPVVDFVSEWRAFVFRQALVGLQWYAGAFTTFPDVATIQRMMTAYESQAPAAYTLDVGVLAAGQTVVVEVHPLVSCGFYGFADLPRIPAMLIAGWRDWLATARKPSPEPPEDRRRPRGFTARPWRAAENG